MPVIYFGTASETHGPPPKLSFKTLLNHAMLVDKQGFCVVDIFLVKSELQIGRSRGDSRALTVIIKNRNVRRGSPDSEVESL